jgi:DNA-binding IclR family transcriptional regulator
VRKKSELHEHVLDCLREGPSTSSELSATTGLSMAHVSSILNRLEKDGHVKRTGKIGRATLFSLK